MATSTIKPFKVVKNNEEATDALMKCARSAKVDITKIRNKRGYTMGQDEAMPYLDAQLFGNYAMGSAKTNSCYLQGNLRTWSASGLVPKAQRENNLGYDKKVSEIKFCKGLVKQFCSGKWTSTI